MFCISKKCEITMSKQVCCLIKKNILILILIFSFFNIKLYSVDKNGQINQKERIALLNLKAVGVNEALANSIEESFLTFIAKQGKYEVIERSQLNKILKEQGLSHGDEFNEETAAQIGNLLGVKIVLIGSVSRMGNNIVINVRGIDVNNAVILFTEIESTKSEDELIDIIELIAVKICREKDTVEEEKRVEIEFNKNKFKTKRDEIKFKHDGVEQIKGQSNLISCKHKVAIIPIFNSSKKSKFDYLSSTISNVLRTELNKNNNYFVFDSATIQSMMSNNNLKNTFIWETDALKMGELLKVDIVVYGYYSIEKNKMIVNYYALDVKKREFVVNLKISNEIGLDVTYQATEISLEMAKQMSYKIKPKLKPTNIVVITFVPVGATILTTGIFMLAFDLTLYSTNAVYWDKYNADYESGDRYSTYLDAYNSYIALFSTSIVLINIGVVMFATSFPLMFYKRLQKKFGFDIILNKDVGFAFSYKF